jgi:hypothetical protein
VRVLFNLTISKFGLTRSHTDAFTHEPFHALNPIAAYLLLLVAVMHILAKLQQSWTRILLKGLRSSYRLMYEMYRTSFSTTILEHIQAIPRDIPSDTPQVQKALQLHQPPSTIYACCPNNRCSKLYPPSSRGTWPERCTNQISSRIKCNTALLKPSPDREPSLASSAPTRQPIRPFVLYDVKHQVAEIAYLEPNATHVKKRPEFIPSHADPLTDIFQGSLVRDFEGPFRGPNGTMHYFDATENETRLLFTISIDWMNPYGVKAAGVSASVGVIALCCVNLPIEIRYKPENLVLAGIIPGPKEPPLDTINYFLEPLIDDFLTLWHRGTQPVSSSLETTTPGPIVRAALLALVTDMPASKKVAGNLSHWADKFCSLCLLDRIDIANLSVDHWPMRDCKTHREQAFAWLNGDRATRKELQAGSGVRYSELFRLPYWDPTRQVVIDIMHNLFLGIIKRHYMVVFGMADESNGKKGGAHLYKEPNPNKFRKGRRLLNIRDESSTQAEALRVNCTWADLFGLSAECGVSLNPIRHANTKASMAEALENWVSIIHPRYHL